MPERNAAREQSDKDEREIKWFLARRLMGQEGHNGVSSDALVAHAAVGGEVPDDVYPHDLGDFGRCCEAFALAPGALQLRMLPTLARWAWILAEGKGRWPR